MQIFGNPNTGKGILNSNLRLRKSSFGLRIAPMIDMIFLLLIFFLVAAKWSPQEDFLPLQLPVANAGSTAQTVIKPEPLTIQIIPTNTGCRVQIGSSHTIDIPSQNPETSLASLMEQTKQCLSEQKRYASDPVEITCAGKVKWENLAQIYNVLYGMGLTDITFQMTEPPKNDNAD